MKATCAQGLDGVEDRLRLELKSATHRLYAAALAEGFEYQSEAAIPSLARRISKINNRITWSTYMEPLASHGPHTWKRLLPSQEYLSTLHRELVVVQFIVKMRVLK